MIEPENAIKQSIEVSLKSLDSREKRENLVHIFKELQKLPSYIPLFFNILATINTIEDISDKRAALNDIVKEIPKTDDFRSLYLMAMESLIDAAARTETTQYRRAELLRIAEGLPDTDEFVKLRLNAFRYAMDLFDKPYHKKASLAEIARELPKSSDISFYRRFTLLGIASELPKSGAFIELYKEAIRLAINAAELIEEPYYREYALIYIARELPKTEEYLPLYKEVIEKAYEAAVALQDPFAKEYALIDILKELPKTQEFYGLLLNVIKETLKFYTMRKSIENIDILGKLDYFIAGETKRLTESKKAKYTKTKYALMLAEELEQCGMQLNDIRFIEILKPYTHIWVQPAKLRAVANKIVDHLEMIRNTYHGREIEKPVFLKEHYLFSKDNYMRIDNKKIPEYCLSIDLGATNTVIMKRKGVAYPEFISLNSISKTYGNIHVVPTIFSPRTNSIGAEAIGKNPLVNIKQLALAGNQKGKVYMEAYIRVLYQNLKKALSNERPYSLLSNNLPEIIYITVPVGFDDYKKFIKETFLKLFRGVEIEVIEEPLAAAIGYQVAEERDRIIMLVDFGGCTLNVMIARINKDTVHVIAKPDRAKLLGGRDIDLWLAAYLAEKAGIQNDSITDELILKSEEIKIALSDHTIIPFQWNNVEVCEVSRKDLEELLVKHDFYKAVDNLIAYIIKKAGKVGIKSDMIEAILLTGGSSQIPSFKEKIAHSFPHIAQFNAIYSHNPLSAAGLGAALYTTKDILIDRHLELAYAIRYATKDSDRPYSYSILLERGESLPLEKTFKIRPARALGAQHELYLELFEVPERLITRKWTIEHKSGIESMKQELKQTSDMGLNDLKIITLPFQSPAGDDIFITFCVNKTGYLALKYGNEETKLDTGIRLQ